MIDKQIKNILNSDNTSKYFHYSGNRDRDHWLYNIYGVVQRNIGS